jgi:ABC-type antimicrobial peptide transport system permease subunit
VLLQLSAGLGIGVLAALAFDRTFQDPASQNGVSMTDPAALGGIVISIAVVAVVACLLPIVRAARVDPLVVLRAE